METQFWPHARCHRWHPIFGNNTIGFPNPRTLFYKKVLVSWLVVYSPATGSKIFKSSRTLSFLISHCTPIVMYEEVISVFQPFLSFFVSAAWFSNVAFESCIELNIRFVNAVVHNSTNFHLFLNNAALRLRHIVDYVYL